MIHGKYRIRHPAIYLRRCPTCGAEIGQPCRVIVTDGPQVGRAIKIHATRRKDMSEDANGARSVSKTDVDSSTLSTHASLCQEDILDERGWPSGLGPGLPNQTHGFDSRTPLQKFKLWYDKFVHRLVGCPNRCYHWSHFEYR